MTTDERTRETRVDDLLDRNEIRRLVDRFVVDTDARRPVAGTGDPVFADDVVLRFPVAEHHGAVGLAELNRTIMGRWSRTLHHVTNAHIQVDGATATVAAKLLATHVHRDDDPGSPFRIGADLTAEARRTAGGWRLSMVAMDLVWAEGDPPGPPTDS